MAAPPRPLDDESPRLSEAELSVLWFGQSFPKEALVTADGSPIQVVYRGRPSGGPGPDFRDAIIALPDSTLRHGDVELHTIASDFYVHGHHRDPRYDRVVLHVVFENDGDAVTTLRNGSAAPVVALGDWVARRQQQLEAWLRAPPLWREPCHDATVRLGENRVTSTLDRLGAMRFRAKVAEFLRHLISLQPDDVLLQALLVAVNYGGNEQAARELGSALRWEAIKQAATCGDVDPAAAILRLILNRSGLESDRPTNQSGAPWRTIGVRPANHPRARLEGAAGLLARCLPDGPAAWATSSVVAVWSRMSWDGDQAQGETVRIAKSLLDFLVVRPVGRRAALIGPERAGEIATNVILPFVAAAGRIAQEAGVEEASTGLMRLLPAPSPYGVTKLVHHYLRDDRGRPIVTTAQRAQGLLYLSRNYCTQGGCGTCPLS